MDVLNPQNLGNLAKGIGVVAGAAWDVATGKISVAEGFQHAADGVGHAMKNTTKALSGIANSTAGQFIGSLAMGAVHMMGDVKIGGRSINEDLADMSAEDPAQAVARKKGSGKKEKLTPDRGLAAAASPQRHPVAMRAVRHPRVSASTMSIEVAANAPAPSFSGPVKKADNDALVVVASGPEPDGGAARDHLGHAHGSNPALALGDGTAG